MSRILKAHLLLIFITLLWGSTFVLVKSALPYISPLLFNALRMLLASLVLMIIYHRKMAALTRPALIAGFTVGLFLFLGYEFQTAGLALTTPSKSAFLTGTCTVLVPLLLMTIWRVKVPLWRVAGIVIALAGLFLMTVPAGAQAVADFANMNRGDLLTVACAFGFAFHIIFLGRATQRFAFEQMAVLQITAAALLMAFSEPLLERPHLEVRGIVIGAIVATSVLCTAVAFSVQAWAQQFTPATHTALIFTLEPVFAWLTSYLFWGERLGARAMAGALLILAGVLLSELLGNVLRVEEAKVTSVYG